MIRQTSTAASKKVPPMGRTPSTTHRWHFCRALYLQPSNQKLVFADKADICGTSQKVRDLGLYVLYYPEVSSFAIHHIYNPLTKKLAS